MGKRVKDGRKVEGGKRGGYKLFRREEETYALNYLFFPFKMFIIGIAHFDGMPFLSFMFSFNHH